MSKILSSEITPEHLYHSRREFIRRFGTLVAGALLLNACGAASGGPAAAGTTAAASKNAGAAGKTGAKTDELGDAANDYAAITGYNNYYEFSTEKEGVAPLAKDFKTTPWTVTVGGMVKQPKTYAIEDVLKRFPAEERIYRLRCVEGWSMVIPWLGFPLRQLLAEVEPTSQAKYVRFETVERPQEMPGQRDNYFPWPYVEGLRLDEAMNDLAILATELYGKPLPPQNGAPLRLVVPWKYGFKSIKAIVKIDLVDEQPQSLWMRSGPNEYGFYANVNPDVPHPRWSQSSERRIGEFSRRKTLPFNGYADKVSQLYAGMDLRKNF